MSAAHYPADGKYRRKTKRTATALLNRHQVRAAYTLYQAGYTVPEIAAAGWQKWGFASQETARTCLHHAFAIDGLKLRTRTEAARLRASTRRCACGVLMHERGPACMPCATRHWRRRRDGLTWVPPQVRTGHCATCGVKWDDRTPGCGSCRHRHRSRRVHRQRVAA